MHIFNIFLTSTFLTDVFNHTLIVPLLQQGEKFKSTVHRFLNVYLLLIQS